MNILILTGAILMLTLSILILDFASAKFGTGNEPKVTEHK
jgi:hypothetical protein